MQSEQPVQVQPVKIKKLGTRQEVWDGLAQMTVGKLTKDQLFENKGRLVSKKASEVNKQLALNRKNSKLPVPVKEQVNKYESTVVSKEQPKPKPKRKPKPKAADLLD